ncbi:hypothetical protein FRB97_000618 [Tulasnella sp. 331]|nr:hypothetical protein FRB97_000618 [Tulasnella sp. 331]
MSLALATVPIPLALVVIFISFIPLIFRRRFVSRLTVLNDLSFLGAARSDSQKIQGTAVVCGGSVAGLFAARICADHFTSVIVVEPEAWLKTDSNSNTEVESRSEPLYRIGHDNVHNLINPRKRVMHYTQRHIIRVDYQAILLDILHRLFTDVEEQAALLGATPQPADWKFTPSGIPFPVPYEEYNEETMPKALFFTRPGFETLLRKLVVKHCPQVKFIHGTVDGINPSSNDRTILESVTIQDSKSEKSWQQRAALVIDATGSSQAGYVRWLEAAGFGVGSPSRSGLAGLRKAYETRRWYITSNFKVGQHLQSRLPIPGGFGQPRILFIYTSDATREDPRSFIIARSEGGVVQFAHGGAAFVERPKTIDQVQKFLASMNPRGPLPKWVHETVEMLRECEEEATHSEMRIPTCSYIQYHKASDLPSNFIAVGDSFLRLSPAMGQGVTKSAMDATTLNALLTNAVGSAHSNSEKGRVALPVTFSKDFFDIQSLRLNDIWESTKASDYGIPGTVPCKDEYLEVGSWRRRYGKYTFILSLKDIRVASRIYHVQQFLAPETDLFLPSITYKVLWHVLKTTIGLA